MYQKTSSDFQIRLAEDRQVSSAAAKIVSLLMHGKPVTLPLALTPAEQVLFPKLLAAPSRDNPRLTQRDRMVFAFTSMTTHARAKGTPLTADDLVAGAITACRADQLTPLEGGPGPARFLTSLANHWASRSGTVDVGILREPARLASSEALWRGKVAILSPASRVGTDSPLI